MIDFQRMPRPAGGYIDASAQSRFPPTDPTISGWLQCDQAAAGATVATLRCLIIDDSPEFLDAARLLLQREGIFVAGVAASGEEGLRLARELRPDVTLVDIDLGADDGIALARRLAGSDGRPAGKVILISTHDEDEFADLIQTSRAVGFIGKAALSAEAIYALTGEGPKPAA